MEAARSTPQEGTGDASEADAVAQVGPLDGVPADEAQDGTVSDVSAPAMPIPHVEALGLEVRLLGCLPLPCTLTIDVPGYGLVRVSSARWVVEAARRRGEPCWAPVAFEAAVYAVQEGRAGAREWAAWCALLTRPGWRLGPREALAGAIGLEETFRAAQPHRGAPPGTPPAEPRLTLGTFLRRVGATLVDAVVEPATPPRGGPQAATAEVDW